MSYNILNKNVNFQGVTQGTIEDIVDTHSGQSITGSKDFLTLTGSNVYVKNNLGIGTASPSEPLHIITTGNGGIEIEAASGAATLTFDMASNDEGRILFKEATESRASIIYDGTGAHSMIFKGRGTNAEVMRINSSGKLGIGTNNPSEILSVAGNISGSGNVSVVGNIAGAAITGTTISGSGVISGSAFYGAASGITGIESAVTLKANGGLANSSGLTIDITNATIETSADNTDYLLIYDGSGLKRITCEKIAGLVDVSDFMASGVNDRVLTATGADTFQGEATLTFNSSRVLTVGAEATAGSIVLHGSMSGSGNLQAGGTLQIAGDITGSSTLYVKSSNNRVGIGTVSPARSLDVTNADGNPQARFSYNTGNYLEIGVEDNTGTGIIKASGGKLILDPATTLIYGTTGIGVTDPDSKLEIYDTGTQLKLSYDASNAATFVVNSAGKLTINTGGDMEIPGNLLINGNATIGNASGDTLIIHPSSITISNVAAGTLNNANSYLGVNSSGALVLTSSAGDGTTDIDGLTELSATPHATQDEYMISDNGTEKRISVTNAANGAFALVSGDATIAAGGALTIAANAVQDGMVNDDVATGLAGDGLAAASGVLKVDLNELTTGTILYSEDYVPFVDYNSGTELSKKVTVSNFIAATAGDGLTNDSGRMKLDLNELTAVDVAVASDFIAIIDANDSNATRKESIADLVTGIASTGLDASGGQLTVDVSDFMTNGVNNRILTATGADAMNAEADLTFASNVLTFGNSAHASLDITDVSGTDTAGKNLTILAGAGTGTGEGGNITFQVAEGGPGSGTSVNSHTTSLTIGTGMGKPITIANVCQTIFEPTAVANLADDGGISITASYVKVDANGGARTGIRFNGTGTAGQILFVENAGGENLTFHSTAGTARITTTTDTDTMMPGEVFMFVSNGSAWFLMGGTLQAG